MTIQQPATPLAGPLMKREGQSRSYACDVLTPSLHNPPTRGLERANPAPSFVLPFFLFVPVGLCSCRHLRRRVRVDWIRPPNQREWRAYQRLPQLPHPFGSANGGRPFDRKSNKRSSNNCSNRLPSVPPRPPHPVPLPLPLHPPGQLKSRKKGRQERSIGPLGMLPPQPPPPPLVTPPQQAKPPMLLLLVKGARIPRTGRPLP